MARRPNRSFRGKPQARGAGRRATEAGGGFAVADRRQAPRGSDSPVEIPSSISVSDLAELLNLSGIEIIKELMKSGTMATVNQVLPFETAKEIATALGFEVGEAAPEETREDAERRKLARLLGQDDDTVLVSRAPVVTVMGHVDHGKTSLLDAIRSTNVTGQEHGGITQHIAAYQVEAEGQKITFLDTPGHAAFTQMRARGAQATDVVVLVVAADDGVMPQTKEAIAHAQAANVPIVVAINKIDKEDANPYRVKQELAENGLVVEDWGGEVPCVPVSAKTREGLDDLLANILVVTEVAELKANPAREGVGVVIEANLDKARGPFATFLVQGGTLRSGDRIVAGAAWGRIKAMFDDQGRYIKQAEPSTPVGILGLNEVPQPGDTFRVVPDDKTGRLEAEEVKNRLAAEANRPHHTLSLDELYARFQQGDVKELNLILKVDVSGSLQPIVQSLQKLGGDNLRVKMVHSAAGNVTESDVMLAVASRGIILGFNNGVEAGARRMADQEGVDIRLYNVIYNLTEDVEKALKGLLQPTTVEVVDGHAEVRQIFKIGRTYAVAGVGVTDGKAIRNGFARVYRGTELLFDGQVGTLKRFKDDVREVLEGYECGVGLEGFHAWEEGDRIEFYHREKQAVA